MKDKKLYQNILLVLFSVILFLIFFELFLFVTDLDTKSLKNTLFYQTMDYQNHKVSTNSELLYELKPNSNYIYFTKQKNDNAEVVLEDFNKTVKINELGFRDKNRLVNKPEKVTRIIIIGSSNTYGAVVSLEETYPIQLENYLNENYLEKFEVWNVGIPGYMLSQEIELAKKIVLNYDPDILIFQLANEGRRMFLNNSDNKQFFKQNKELYNENIPLLISNNKKAVKLHEIFILMSRTYRFFMIKINNIIIKKNLEPNCSPVYMCLPREIFLKYDYGNKISEEKKKDFVLDNIEMPILFFDPIFDTYCLNSTSINRQWINLTDQKINILEILILLYGKYM